MNNANFDKDLKNTNSYAILKDITPTSANKGMQQNCSTDIKVCCLLFKKIAFKAKDYGCTAK